MDNAFNSSDDAFTADEEAAWGAMSSDDGAPEPASAPAPVAGGEAAPAPAAPAAAPAGEPAAAPGEVVDPEVEEDDAEQNKGKFVRHGAFHQERERRKAAERERDETRLNIARMEERLRLLSEAPKPAAQAPAEPETPPDPNEDIFGAYAYLKAELDVLKNGHQQITAAQQAERDAQAQQSQRGETLNAYRTDVQRVMAASPEFGEAYEHVFQGRVAELVFLGVPQADALKAVREEEMEMAQAAIAAGQSPAERILQFAKIRGFAPKAAAPVAPAAAPAETAAEKSARIAKGQAASLSLSSAGGAPAGELTLEMLASMSEADFAKMEKANPARVRALMGGE